MGFISWHNEEGEQRGEQLTATAIVISNEEEEVELSDLLDELEVDREAVKVVRQGSLN